MPLVKLNQANISRKALEIVCNGLSASFIYHNTFEILSIIVKNCLRHNQITIVVVQKKKEFNKLCTLDSLYKISPSELRYQKDSIDKGRPITRDIRKAMSHIQWMEFLSFENGKYFETAFDIGDIDNLRVLFIQKDYFDSLKFHSIMNKLCNEKLIKRVIFYNVMEKFLKNPSITCYNDIHKKIIDQTLQVVEINYNYYDLKWLECKKCNKINWSWIDISMQTCLTAQSLDKRLK